DGQIPRRLQLNATTISSPHAWHRTRAKPWARMTRHALLTVHCPAVAAEGASSAAAGRSRRNRATSDNSIRQQGATPKEKTQMHKLLSFVVLIAAVTSCT